MIVGETAKASNFIKDATIETFEKDVIEASMKAPVLVDFWAEWCGPCKQLGSMLEKAVVAANGAVSLVKIDIDKNQMLASQLRIQSVPTVYAFFQGRPVDGFQGAVPESQIKEFIDRLSQMGGQSGGAADLGAYTTSGTLSIYDLISQAARTALEGEFEVVVSQCEAAAAMPSAVPSTSSVPSSEPTASGKCSSNAVNANARCSVDTDCTCTATRNLQHCADQSCKNDSGCCPGFECIKVKGSGTCQQGETSSPTVNPSSSPSSFPSVSSLPSASPSDRPSLRPSVTPPVFCGCILPTTDRPSTTPSVMPSVIPTKPPVTLATCGSFSKRKECQNNGCMCSNNNGPCGTCVDMS